MADSLRVKLIANAGLLLEYEGTTFLLDAIYGTEGHPFSNLKPEIWKKILDGQAPFERIDYLLFTHAHPDHFSPEMTLEFLKHHRVKGVFMPDTRSVAESGLIQWLRQEGIPCALLSEQTDHASYKVAPGVTVKAFRTLHLDKKFERVKHFCYLITFGDKPVLFTADLDYVTEDLCRLKDIRLRAAFINPLFFGVLRRGKFFRGKLNTGQICVYHVPFAEDDEMGMRDILERDIAQWPVERAWVTALLEPFQEMNL